MTEFKKDENPESCTYGNSSSKEEIRKRTQKVLEKANCLLTESGSQGGLNKPVEDDKPE